MDEFILVHQTRMRKSQLFTVSMRQQVPYGTNQGFNNGSEPWNECFSLVHAQLLNMHQTKSYLELANGGNN